MGAVAESSALHFHSALSSVPSPRRVTPHNTQRKAQWLYFLAFAASSRLRILLNGAYTRNDRVWRNVTPINRPRLLEVAPYRGDRLRSGVLRVHL